MITKEPLSVTCADGVELRGTLIKPEAPKAVVQFNGGTAARKEFYLPFLEYLAGHGYLCALWDYRGSGDSAPDDLSTCEYTFLDYGTKDMPAVKAYLNERFPDLPFFLFGHSVGGQQAGFMHNLDGVQGMVNYAVSTGHGSHMPLAYRVQAYYFFYLFTPLSIALTGYVKAKPFGIMENLPRKVVTEWRAWCTKPGYFFDPKFYGKTVPVGRYKSYDFPVHTFWATDDPISNPRTVPGLWDHIHSSEEIGFTKLVPSAMGVKGIGHFGFFKRKMKDLLWGRALSKLEEYYRAKQPA